MSNKRRLNKLAAETAANPPQRIARCAPCRKGGVTNTNVVALASPETPDCIAGDFLCVFHDHRTSLPLPEEVRARQN